MGRWQEGSHGQLLAIRNLSKTFGGLTAINSVSMSIQEGQINALIGPNGAGKTTLLNLVSGLEKPDDGSILFHGHPIEGLAPAEIVCCGIGRTFQLVRLFGGMTALQNVMVGRHARTRAGTLACMLGLRSARREERGIEDEAWHLLRFVELDDLAHLPAQTLPLGKQRQLELARALATEPRLLLLDEPLSGLSAVEVERLLDVIQAVRTSGITILFVEHNVKAVMRIADEVCVLNHGEKIAEGRPADIVRNTQVIQAYLGAGFKAVERESDEPRG